jgi:hypothetical protein
MLDAAYSRQKLHVDHAAVRARRQPIIPLVAAFVLVGGGSRRELQTSFSRGLEVTQQQLAPSAAKWSPKVV